MKLFCFFLIGFSQMFQLKIFLPQLFWFKFSFKFFQVKYLKYIFYKNIFDAEKYYINFNQFLSKNYTFTIFFLNFLKNIFLFFHWKYRQLQQ